MRVIKRNGSEETFDKTKIIKAVQKANASVDDASMRLSELDIEIIASSVETRLKNIPFAVNIEDISDMVENEIMRFAKFSVARAYIQYRYKRTMVRQSNTTDDQILSLIALNNEEVKQENSNKNPTIVSVQRDYMAGEVSKDLARRYFLPEDVLEHHDSGKIHFHDMDYCVQPMHNCCLINLDDMFTNGTVISKVGIDPPKSFLTRCNVGTQVVAQVASSQYGGQSITLAHLAPGVDISRRKIREQVIEEHQLMIQEWEDMEWVKPRKVLGDSKKGRRLKKEKEQFYKEKDKTGKLLECFSAETLEAIVEKRLRKEIESGVQTIQYQITTLMTTNGQAPFVTVCMYLNEVPEGQLRDDLALIIEEVLKQRIKGVKDETGAYVISAFPKLIYVLQEDNITPGSKYWYLTELAAKCIAKCMVPDCVSEKKMKELKNGDCYPPMGCRSFLTPDRVEGNPAKAKNYVEGKTKYYGRFNQGVVTLNLVDIACSSGGNEERFWEIMEERLNVCHKALRCRHERLLGTPSDVAPILWQHGALARLEKGETIDKLLYGGYSTISLGYAGLCECTRYMKGVSHTHEDGKEFALSVMRALNDACAKWKAEENIDYSVYGTPLESTTYKFAKCLQKRFGIIEGVTDKNYITNSYHVHVTEDIDAFTKLSFEAEFQELSPGGAISYVEVPDMKDNIPAVLAVLQHIYENIMYAELNIKSDFCTKCGYDGEIKIVKDEHGKLVWECPCCGNRDQDTMHVARRTCGYIGKEYWNQGRTAEINDRKLHL